VSLAFDLFGPLPEETPEACTLAGAERLKQKIEDYWARRGQAVAVTPVYKSFSACMRTGWYEIQSDMRNGLPSPPETH
jgi:hypothetical protein